MNWVKENSTAMMGRVIAKQVPIDYFTAKEYAKIVEATYHLNEYGERPYDAEKRGVRIRALTELLRWSGLRIRDAVTLERSRLVENKLLLYQAKTGTPVYVPLPPEVAELLRKVPDGLKPNPRYFFWSGNGDPKTFVANWQRSYRRLFKIADLCNPDGSPKRTHCHMFRDTFAVGQWRYGPTQSKALVCEGEDGTMQVYYRGVRVAFIELKEPHEKPPGPCRRPSVPLGEES